MNAMQPDTIRAQDYVGTFGDGDHDDHHAGAFFAHSAHLSYATPHTFIGYVDYASEGNAPTASTRILRERRMLSPPPPVGRSPMRAPARVRPRRLHAGPHPSVPRRKGAQRLLGPAA